MQHRAFILLGGNLGDVPGTFKKAIARIGQLGEIEALSRVYKSAPWGMESAFAFLNQAVCLRTDLVPHKLLDALLVIERELGRTRASEKQGYTDRVLDLDVLLFDHLEIEQADLVVPHPRMHLRRFALLPMAEIAAKEVHPVFQKTVVQLLDACKDEKEVAVYEV